ncbi:UDP-N-acetylglucosamine--N-acetylmuramyl-(pentapeptide) pyrophosphoryl-undecaprenol N-acetylglucosamine transferase, partial [Candidatus Peregrinibacteria bacterium CG_4_10_14_0_2_um_filter_43_11]
MQNPTRILLVGGGSGGHIIPNLAVSSELKAQNPSVQLLYIGSRNPPDRTLVEKAGIPFRSIFTGKLRRYFSMRNFIDPFQVVIGIFQSIYFVARFWPDVVFTKGGFVSFPVTLAAFVLRRPVVLHESDAVMGLTNRITAKIATKVCVGFPNYLHLSDRFVLTGNPVRSSILHGSKDRGYQLTGFSVDRPVLLAWGGSQGAQEINDLIESRFSLLEPHFQIVHITG